MKLTLREQNRLPAFMIMAREWRHLKMLKRAGRGHDPVGVQGTQPGSLAVLCPACPRPGINLRPGWDSVPSRDRYVFHPLLTVYV